MDENIKCPGLANGFTINEQFYAQVTFHGWWISGFLGIALQHWGWALLYFFIVAFGILGIVQRHLTCPRCPHLHEHGSCLQLYPKITILLIKEKKHIPFSFNEKLIFILIFISITIFPIYWLRNNITALAGFILFGSMWYSGQLLYFCKRCRIPSCPFNRVNKRRKI